MNRQVAIAIGKRITVDLLILLVILSLVIAVTGIPKDFGITYQSGETIVSLTTEDVLVSIKNQFRQVISGDAFKVTIKGESVMDILRTAFVRSSFVLAAGTILAILIGVFKGVIDSRKRGRTGTFKLLQSLIPLSIPDILTIALVQLGALYLFRNEIPFLGLGVIPHIGDESLLQAVYPILSIAILPAAIIARTVAGTIEEGLEKPYVLAAKGKGCSLSQIIWTHLSKPIAFSVISILPMVMGIVFSSMVIIEMFFFYRGIGYQLIYFYTTSLVPKHEANLAFTVFILALSLMFYVVFTLLGILKLMILPRIKTN